MVELDDQEWAFRLRRYEQLRARFDDLDDQIEQARKNREAGRAELDEILAAFETSGDAQALKVAIDGWSRNKSYYGFAGPNGAMFLNQLVNDSKQDDITPLLRRAIAGPSGEDDARQTLEAFVSHTEDLREGGSAAQVGRVAPFLTWFWWLRQPDEWPMQWKRVMDTLESLGFVDEDEPWGRYATYREHVRRMGPFAEVEMVLSNLEPPDLGLDVTAVERCARIGKLAIREDEDDGTYVLNRASLGVLRANMKLIGQTLKGVVSSQLGRECKPTVAPEFWNAREHRLREDCWVYWRPESDGLTPYLQLSVDSSGVKLGLIASSLQKGGKGYADEALEALADQIPEGMAWLPWGVGFYEGKTGSDWPTWSMLGSVLPPESIDPPNDLERTFIDSAQALRPCFENLWGTTPALVGRDSAEMAPEETRSAFEAFVAETGYPTDDDREHRRQRELWAEQLQSGRLSSISVDELRRLYNGNGYGNPGPQSILNTTLKDAESETLERLLTAIEYLLWDEQDDFETRIDRVMDEDDLGLRGFKEGVIMKLLSIAHPDRFLPIFPFTNKNGKAALLNALDLVPPAMSKSVGTRHVESNDMLREFGERYLPGDPWGQKSLIYWLRDREEETGTAIDTLDVADGDRVGAAAEKLNLPREFLEEIESLLRNHKQVVFYGPPGTGKTYVAQHLAEAIAPTEEQRLLIQFHPSTSYEDFFEGFRPVGDGDQGVAYRLVDGPLRVMADRASTDPLGRPHILIIDEINRANLAKVLGELLFLLEYRDRDIRPLYRPEEPFSLPKNLWIIGTMNTADRSIATVDAALRRRFHFVPFVPDDREKNPIAGLLRRWCKENDIDDWLPTLVDGVNQQLRRELGGDHLLIGPSYFMDENLDEDGLAQIWKYRIEPLVDDLFFGSDKAKDFHFTSVWARFGPSQDHTE